jgi:hypothetical protein
MPSPPRRPSSRTSLEKLETRWSCGECSTELLDSYLRVTRGHVAVDCARTRSCPHCRFATPSKKILLHHVECQHDHSSRVYCPYCAETFRSRSALHTHVGGIHDVEDHECGLCPFGAKDLTLLFRHIETDGRSSR